MKAKSRASARAAACVLAGLAVLAPCPSAAFLPNLSMNTSGSLRSANVAIFNNFQRESSIGRAQFSQRVAQLQEDDSRLAARQEADAALGVATILDVLISQNAADQASVDVVTSRYDYVLARAELESILGRVL